MSILKSDDKKDVLKVVLRFSEDIANPLVELNHDLWSKNRPVLLWRHSLKNVSEKVLEDVKAYIFMDFDIGGPRSYKDDMGKFDPEEKLMVIWDDNKLFVVMNSRPEPSRWEISAPFELTIKEDHRDLENILEHEPGDIAAGLQWNLGDLQPGCSATVDVVITAAVSLDEAKKYIPLGWQLFGTKIQ